MSFSFPKSINALIAPLYTAFAIAFICSPGLGCQQTQESAKADSKPASKEKADASDTQTAEASTPKSLSDMTLLELLREGDNAIKENRIPDAKAAMTEARGREKISGGAKMDIARILFAAGEMKESSSVYDEVVEAIPQAKPQLWQRGLALYYADEFEKGVDQFESHQTYNSQDVENSVWHLLCQSNVTSVEEARKKMIKIERDSRIPMKQVFDMFAGTGSPEEVLKACEYDPENVKPNSEIYHGLLYVGLFHEMMGDQKASNESMTEALKFKPWIRGLMGHVAEGHLRVRKAYPAEKVAK